MLRVLFFLLLCLPFAELALLVFLGRNVGILQTIGLALITSLIGGALAKQQGLRVIAQWQRAHVERRVPEEGLVSGLLVLIGAGMLLLPGFISDIIGLIFLLPPTRRFIAAMIRNAVAAGILRGNIRVVTPESGPIIQAGPPPHLPPPRREVDD